MLVETERLNRHLKCLVELLLRCLNYRDQICTGRFMQYSSPTIDTSYKVQKTVCLSETDGQCSDSAQARPVINYFVNGCINCT